MIEAIRGVASEAVGKVAGKAAMQKVIAIPMVMSPKVGFLVAILPVVTLGSSSQLHGSPPYASQVPNPLPWRPIDYLAKCLQVG